MAQQESSILTDFVPRLRECRGELGLTQAQFADVAGVGLGAQNRYEAGATEPSASYFAHLANRGVDVLWLLTGRRTLGVLDEDQGELLTSFSALAPVDRAVLLRIAASLADRSVPSRLVHLPTAEALEAAFGGFLEGSPGLAGDELVHELATHLPTILEGAADELPAPMTDRLADPLEQRAAGDVEHRAGGRGQRS